MHTTYLPRFIGVFIAFVMAFAGCASAPPPKTPHAETTLPGFATNSGATFRIDGARGHGSAVAFSHEGHLVTAAHVVDGRDPPYRILMDVGGPAPATYPVSVVAVDAANDIALVKIDRKLDCVAILEDPALVRRGDAVYSIGHMFDLGETVGRGHIMQLHYTDPSPNPGPGPKYADLTVIDTIDGPGMSGAGFFSADTGRFVGAMRAIFTAPTGPGRAPISFRVATSGTHVKALLDANKVPYRIGPQPEAEKR